MDGRGSSPCWAHGHVRLQQRGLFQFIFSNGLNYWLLIGAELALVFYLSAAINRMSAQKAMLYFLVYSAINGITMSSIFLMYTASSIASTFFITAGTFGARACMATRPRPT